VRFVKFVIQFTRPKETMPNLFSLEGRIAIVTGGMGQLGKQYCSALVQNGARVAVLDMLSPEDPRVIECSATYKSNGFHYVKCNITSKDDLLHALESIRSKWSTPYILVNNAALDSPPSALAEENGPFEEYPEASFDKVMAVNVKGIMLACQVFGGAMAAQGRGSIINISSIYGMVSPNQDIYEYRRKRGAAFFKPIAYSASKSALFNLTRYLATYWAKKGVRVNTLTLAGVFNSQDEDFLREYCKRIPIGRMASPDEYNGAVIFLASDASAYMTGSNLVIDGGWTAW